MKTAKKTPIPSAFDLSKYAKASPESKPIPWTTSVTLTTEHRKFIESANINFSELVRDFVDSLMKGG